MYLRQRTLGRTWVSGPAHKFSVFGPTAGLETNARPLARGELHSVRASGSSDLTSPVGEWIFYGDLSTILWSPV